METHDNPHENTYFRSKSDEMEGVTQLGIVILPTLVTASHSASIDSMSKLLVGSSKKSTCGEEGETEGGVRDGGVNWEMLA